MSSVTIGMTTKGINSTSRLISGGVSLDCRLKEPCGLHNPVFIVKGLSKSYNNYNYCTWRGRYYWVNEIVFLTNDIQEVHCSLDPLATFKVSIDNATAFVQFSSSNQNTWADDPRFTPEKEDPNWSYAKKYIPPFFSKSGYVVLRVMDCLADGGVKTWAISTENFSIMLDDLTNKIKASTTIGEAVAAMGGFGSWRDNILSCKWIPIGITNLSDASTGYGPVGIGAVVSTVNGYYLPTMYIQKWNGTLSLDMDDLADMAFLRNARWVSSQLYTPFGYCDLPVDYLFDLSDICLRYSVNLCTGEITLRVSEGTDTEGQTFAVFNGNIGVDLMGILGSGKGAGSGLANAIGNAVNMSASIVGAYMSMGTSAANLSIATESFNANPTASGAIGINNARTNMVSQQISSGIDLINSLPTNKNVHGGNGTINGGTESLMMVGDEMGAIVLTRKVFVPSEFSNDHYAEFCQEYGYPYNNWVHPLSSLSGYTKCSGAFVRDIPGATPADISTINSFLNNGIILED